MSSAPQLSPAGVSLDPLALGDVKGAGRGAAAWGTAHGACIRDYCTFLNRRLACVARDPAIPPEHGAQDGRTFVHSSVLCCAGAGTSEDAVLSVANLKGVLLNQGCACVRVPHADASRADMWRLDVTPGARSAQNSYHYNPQPLTLQL